MNYLATLKGFSICPCGTGGRSLESLEKRSLVTQQTSLETSVIPEMHQLEVVLI